MSIKTKGRLSVLRLLLLFKINFIVSLLVVPNICFSQRQEGKVLSYNIILGGFSSGIGAVINTEKGDNWRRNFLTSFWQGSLGGVLHYSGKKTVYLIYNNSSLLAAWPSKILHAAGSSLIENAALNRPFLTKWNIDIGPVRLDYDSREKKFKARFLPSTIYTCISGLQDGPLDLKLSILTGTLVFQSDNYVFDGHIGASYGRGFVYVNKQERYHAIAHELVHTYQYSEYQFFNLWLTPFARKKTPTSLKRIFDRYVYFDLPYFIPIYMLEGDHQYYFYYRNFFEFEAERFATNSYIPIH